MKAIEKNLDEDLKKTRQNYNQKRKHEHFDGTHGGLARHGRGQDGRIRGGNGRGLGHNGHNEGNRGRRRNGHNEDNRDRGRNGHYEGNRGRRFNMSW